MKNKKNLFIAVFCLMLIFLILFNPSKYINSCLNGFIIFGKKVLPALFPFFFLTKLLCETNIVNKLVQRTSGLTSKLYNTSGVSSYVFLMSIISGYPIGAKLTADFYENNLIDKNEAFRISTFTSTSGPLFIIGTVGIGMFASYKLAIIILISHILGAILNGLIFRNYKVEKPKSKIISLNHVQTNVLSDCMYNALVSIMLVGGFIAFFTVVIDAFLALPFISSLKSKYFLSGIIEITRGCFELSKLNLSPVLLCTLSTFLISFGGFSIHAQALTFLSRCKIKMGLFLLSKLSHAIISSLIAFIICLIIL